MNSKHSTGHIYNGRNCYWVMLFGLPNSNDKEETDDCQDSFESKLYGRQGCN